MGRRSAQACRRGGRSGGSRRPARARQFAFPGAGGRPDRRSPTYGTRWPRGFADFAAYRTDVIFLCVIYPVVGLVLARLASGYGLLPLLFPLASGFALVGPFAAVGLNEMSRRREQGDDVRWVDAFGVLRSPSIGAILLLGLVLMAMFLLWLVAAQMIYASRLARRRPRRSRASSARCSPPAPAGR